SCRRSARSRSSGVPDGDVRWTARGRRRSESIPAMAMANGHSRAARTIQALKRPPLSSRRRQLRESGFLGFLVFLLQDLHDLAQAAVAVEELDLLEALEHVLRVEAVAGRRPLFLQDEAHHGVVVDGLSREAAVLHDLPDLEQLLRRHALSLIEA